MDYHLAQLNIAKFRLPIEHPTNVDFVNNLDRVNATAESQPGFIWRLVGEGNSATDIRAYDDPEVIPNLSVWADVDSLMAFVYRNEEHRKIMHRRREWFEKLEFHLVLWWVKAGHEPTLDEAKQRLEMLSKLGSTERAFTFARLFPAPGEELLGLVVEKCASE